MRQFCRKVEKTTAAFVLIGYTWSLVWRQTTSQREKKIPKRNWKRENCECCVSSVWVCGHDGSSTNKTTGKIPSDKRKWLLEIKDRWIGSRDNRIDNKTTHSLCLLIICFVGFCFEELYSYTRVHANRFGNCCNAVSSVRWRARDEQLEGGGANGRQIRVKET